MADLAGNTSIGGGGLKEGGGNAAMLRFYDVSFIFRDNRSAQFPITLFISENSFSLNPTMNGLLSSGQILVAVRRGKLW